MTNPNCLAFWADAQLLRTDQQQQQLLFKTRWVSDSVKRAMDSAENERRVTIVQYDLTSSDDTDSDGASYIYWSSKLSPPRDAFQSDNQRELDHDDDERDLAETGAQYNSSSGRESESEDSDPSPDSSSSRDSDSPDTVRPPNKALSKSVDTVIHISSSDGEMEIQAEPTQSPKKPYAARIDELPKELRAFLAEAMRFFTRPHSLERSSQQVALSTYTKAQERVLCFLGHVHRQYPKVPLTPDVFTRVQVIESYLDHLKEQRRLSPATISNHASSLLYPLKYFHRKQAPNYSHVPIIAQLRKMATLLQREGDVARPRTREELRALNKWLDWDEVLEATERQRSRFEVTRSKTQRAREAADHLLLQLYCHIPPSRGLEIRTLEVVRETELREPFAPSQFVNRNIALLKRDGGVTIHVQSYKTSKFAGSDTVPIQADSELCRFFKQYVREFREELCNGQRNDYLFVNSNGQPYSSGTFSRHLKNLMVRLTGTEVSVNTLRSSFLTWAYSQSECDDALKDSLAAALRHSREQAQTTYDRRTASEKKAAALHLARRKAEEGPHDGALASSSQPSEQEIAVGQFVGLVAENSTLQKPSIFLGRVQAFLPGDQVCLLWYKNSGGSVYSLDLESEQWLESKDSLVPVKVAPAKGRAHAYRLLTSLRTVHKQVKQS